MLVKNIRHEIRRLAAALAVRPLPAIPHAANLAVQPDGAALAGSDLRAPIEACLEQFDAETAVFQKGAIVDVLHRDTMLHSTVLDQLALRNIVILLSHAHRETQVGLRVRVVVLGAELDDVAQAFLLAVLA